MKKTQRLIVVVGPESHIKDSQRAIAGFKACTIVKSVSSEILENVFHFNKNAVYFSLSYKSDLLGYDPIFVCLSNSTDIENDILGIDTIIEDFPKILDQHNIDVGDHSSQDSKKNVSSANPNCLLCKIRDRESDQPEHIVYETNNFYVVPGTGAFFKGYLMIVPKEHVMSFALLPADQLEEFHKLLNDMRMILNAIYGNGVFAFECGSGRTGGGKHETSIVHAHFHLAPTDMPVLQEVLKSGLNPAPIEKQDLAEFGEHPYMLYVDQDENWFIASDPSTYYPRQHPRQVLAEYMGCYEEYNWRIHPYRERMDVIAEEFRSFCKENLHRLPLWMRNCVRFED